MNGIYNAECKGTAWFCDLKLEEAAGYSNQWNVLAVIFKHAEGSIENGGVKYEFSDSFDGKDVDYLAKLMENTDQAIEEISGGRMVIKSMDVVTTEIPFTDWLPWGRSDPYTGEVHSGFIPDMDSENACRALDSFLDCADKTYNQIIIILPLSVSPGWLGLSGSDYRGCNLCKLNNVPGEKYYYGQDASDILGPVHEMEHNLENDTRELGYDIANLHNAAAYGYEVGSYEWYVAYMRDQIPGAKGIDIQAYQVPQGFKTIFTDPTENTEKPKETTVTLTFADTDIAPLKVTAGRNAQKPKSPVKKGYRFGGWYADKNYDENFDFYALLTEDTTVYAQWTKKKPKDKDFVIEEGELTKYKGNGGVVTIPADVHNIVEAGALFCGKDVTKFKVAKDNRRYSAQEGVLFTNDLKTLLAYPRAAQRKKYTVPAGTVKIGNRAFQFNRYLNSLKLPEGLKEIETCSLLYCSNLKHVNLPNSLEVIGFQSMGAAKFLSGKLNLPALLTTIGQYAFHDSGITEVTIPENVHIIEKHTFENNRKLKRVNLPKGITEIREEAFKGCKKLSDIYFAGTKAQWDAVECSKANIPPNCVIHCAE